MVYVDLLVIIDLLFNYVILLTVGVLLNRIVHFKNLFLAAVIGTINLVIIFLDVPGVLVMASSFVFSLLMVLICFKFKDIIYTIKNIMYMYFSGIFYAGGIYLVNTNFFPNIESILLYLIILIIIIPILTIIYINGIKNITCNHLKYYYVDIYLNNSEKIRVVGFLDTGNKLIDPYGCRPIILLRKDLIKDNNLKKILVPYNTVNNHSLLECIIPKEIYIEKVGVKRRVVIGLMDDVNIEGVDCILNEKLL